jgi:CheY-like chemotaxis protein
MTTIEMSGDRGGDPSDADTAAGKDPDLAKDAVRVLVVEDEWLVSMEIEAALEEAGHVCAAIAVSADQAVALAEQHRPDILLMDIRLRGERDGVDAAIEIFRRFGLRCLFISAHTDRATRERGNGANPYGWLAKPFSSAQLMLAIERALSAPGARQPEG